MLILSRRPGESIMVGTEVIITMVRLRGGYGMVGITAPRDIVVRREELLMLPEREEVWRRAMNKSN